MTSDELTKNFLSILVAKNYYWSLHIFNRIYLRHIDNRLFNVNAMVASLEGCQCNWLLTKSWLHIINSISEASQLVGLVILVRVLVKSVVVVPPGPVVLASWWWWRQDGCCELWAPVWSHLIDERHCPASSRSEKLRRFSKTNIMTPFSLINKHFTTNKLQGKALFSSADNVYKSFFTIFVSHIYQTDWMKNCHFLPSLLITMFASSHKMAGSDIDIYLCGDNTRLVTIHHGKEGGLSWKWHNCSLADTVWCVVTLW